MRWISSSDLPRMELRIHDGVRRDLLLLAAVGLYAVIAYSLAQWQQELGIRIALGASARDVMRLTLGDALKLSGMGAVIEALSIASNRFIEAGLLGVAPGRLSVVLGFADILVASALVAAYFPARRAAATGPLVALRAQ